MAGPLIIRIIGDERSYIRAAENTLATNTKLDASFATVGGAANKSADLQITAAVKARRAQEATLAVLQSRARTLPAGSSEQQAANALAIAAQAKLARQLGTTTKEGRAFAASAREGERDFGKLSRGVLAGSGVFSGLGRSLAFASGGFLAFASGAQLLRSSIDAARQLAVAQRQVNQQLKVAGTTWDAYGKQIDKADLSLSHISGFTQPQLLQSFGFLFRVTNNVNTALRLNAVAADVARARNISLSAASLALSKAFGGQVTALRRLGVVVPQNLKGMQALNFVAAKFAGQAQAGTSAADRFTATFVSTQEIIGKTLLPIVNRYLARLGDWLQKMNETGRLQRDVNTAVHDAGAIFNALVTPIRLVDKVTGSFENTLKALFALKAAFVIGGWISSLEKLAVSWGLVKTAATGAAAAEAAAGAGAGAAAGGGLLARLLRGSRGAAGTGIGLTLPESAATLGLGAIVAGTAQASFSGPSRRLVMLKGRVYQVEVAGRGGRLVPLPDVTIGVAGAPVISRQLVNLPQGGSVLPTALQVPGFQPQRPQPQAIRPAFGTAQPIKPLTQFDLTPLENLAAARAQLTQSTKDDVAAARQVVARIKRLLDQGRLKGAGLIQAIQAEGSALSTIWSAEDAAAQKRAQAAAAAKQRIEQQIQDSIDPLRLEVQLSRDQALGRPTVRDLEALRSAARKAIASGKLTLAQQKEAFDQITSLNQQIKDARTGSSATFAAPLKLQLALAKDQALGLSPTKDLLKLRAAILKFIATHKKNTAALIDAYGQLDQVNQQLGSSAQSALGLFKKQNTRKLGKAFGLTGEALDAFREAISQVGPGGTSPTRGTGAFGFAINQQTDRPIVIHTHVDLNQKEIGRSVTKVQQRRRRRNPSQRRGPNAGAAAA